MIACQLFSLLKELNRTLSQEYKSGLYRHCKSSLQIINKSEKDIFGDAKFLESYISKALSSIFSSVKSCQGKDNGLNYSHTRGF